MTAPSDSSIPTKAFSIDHPLLVFFFFFFIIVNCNYGSFTSTYLKMKMFLLFTIVYSKINMLLRPFRLSNNLPTQIKENIDFLRQKPWQLPSAKANFEGCIVRSMFPFVFNWSWNEVLLIKWVTFFFFEAQK